MIDSRDVLRLCLRFGASIWVEISHFPSCPILSTGCSLAHRSPTARIAVLKEVEHIVADRQQYAAAILFA